MKNKKGFTLIEILVVIVLVALLLGIGIPGVMKISQNMKKRSLNTKLDLVEQAAILYGQDIKHYYKMMKIVKPLMVMFHVKKFQ